MKKGTCKHPKMGKLARILGIPRHQAVGIMVELWEWVADYAVAGNVGMHTNEEIASGIGWEGDANCLIDALVGSGWVDSCDTNRLIIHDWETGCDEWIKKRIKRINGAADNGCQRHPKSASLGKAREGKVREGKVGEGGASRFLSFWNIYPNKTGKANAELLWTGRKPLVDKICANLDSLAEQIIAAVKAQSDARTSAKSAGTFFAAWKDGDSWLYNKRWEDGIAKTTAESLDAGVDAQIAERRKQEAENKANAATPEERKAILAQVRAGGPPP